MARKLEIYNSDSAFFLLKLLTRIYCLFCDLRTKMTKNPLQMNVTFVCSPYTGLYYLRPNTLTHHVYHVPEI